MECTNWFKFFNYECLMFYTYHSWVPLWEAWKYNTFSHYLFNFLTYLKLNKNFQKSTFFSGIWYHAVWAEIYLSFGGIPSTQQREALFAAWFLQVALRLCEHGVTSQKIVFFIVIAMRTSKISIYLWRLLSFGRQWCRDWYMSTTVHSPEDSNLCHFHENPKC